MSSVKQKAEREWRRHRRRLSINESTTNAFMNRGCLHAEEKTNRPMTYSEETSNKGDENGIEKGQ